jgi:site-specific recombinase XerD
MDDPKAELETLKQQLRGVGPSPYSPRTVSDRDRESLLDFAGELAVRRSETGHQRQLKLLRHCVIMAEEAGNLAAALDDEAEAKRIVSWIHDAYDPEGGTRGESWETNADYRKALKKFGRLASTENGEDVPDSMEWISSGTPTDHIPEPNPAEMLAWDPDVLDMIDACRGARDEALIAIAFDAGMRPGELHALRTTSFADSTYSLKIHVDGKRGQRSIDLIPSTPYVERWRSIHPAPDGTSAPLWTTESSTPDDLDRVSYRALAAVFERVGARAGITKPTTPENFRRSNASWLAKQPDSNAALIEDRQGRKRGSDEVARYVARFGGEAEALYARIHGIDTSADESEPIGPVTCPRCDRETPREKPLCVWCSQALSPTAVEKADEHDDALDDSFAELATAAARGDVSADRVEELIEHLSGFRELIDDNPELRAAVLAGDATAADDDTVG